MILLLLAWAGCADKELSGLDDTLVLETDTPAVDTDTPDPTAPSRCEVVTASVVDAGFADRVTVSCEGDFAWIGSDTIPDHTLMNGITGTNDQVPVPAPGYRSPVALSPARAAEVTTIDAALGVAVNGVPIYDYTSQGLNDPTQYDPRADTLLTGELDVCNGHAGRGDDYHYHAAPVCMIAAMANRGPAAILGWAFDGYPILGDTERDGAPVGELDACNGKDDAEFGYAYHTSASPPYITQCLVGAFDLALAPRVRPLAGERGGGKGPGEKPPGGVQNLQLVQDADGTRTMTYDHQGQSYAIRYRPAETSGCWDFEERSYTTGGVTTSNTWCRETP